MRCGASFCALARPRGLDHHRLRTPGTTGARGLADFGTAPAPLSGVPEPLDPSEAPFPERAPPVARRIRLQTHQWVGIGIFTAVVVAALGGAFGQGLGRVEAQNGDLAVELRYPTRFHFKQIAPIELWVENRAGRPLSGLTVSFAPDYLRAFSQVTFLPAAERPYVVELDELAAGARQLVTVSLQAERYGSHHGEVRIAGGAESLTLPLETLVYP